MSETHVISALRAKRLEISAHVHDTEKKLARLRASLANLDAAINLLTPDHPDALPPRRGYRRTRYFARNELSRLMLDTLRKAGAPLTAREIAAAAVEAKALPVSSLDAVTEMALTVLRCLRSRGSVLRVGSGPSSRWQSDGGTLG